eukprot:Opistho-2@71561
MWQANRLMNNVAAVVMNYSEIEKKVRDATNTEAWGPSGTQMADLAKLSYNYQEFPEIMNMLWKRMLKEKAWRVIYKSLLLLDYLLKNGSERVVEDARDHVYDIRNLESFKFVDEQQKDQGLNVRHKAKDLVNLIQDDDRLRDERTRAKKNKDKYIGVGNHDDGGYRGTYDDEPSSIRRPYNDEGSEERPTQSSNRTPFRDDPSAGSHDRSRLSGEHDSYRAAPQSKPQAQQATPAFTSPQRTQPQSSLVDFGSVPQKQTQPFNFDAFGTSPAKHDDFSDFQAAEAPFHQQPQQQQRPAPA